MRIKTGDKVKLIAGKDKGKKGKVLQVFPEKNKASVEGLNLAIKNLRPRKQGEKGQKIEFPAPVDVSSMMLMCPKCNKPTRIKYKILEKSESKKERKQRICAKCKELVD